MRDATLVILLALAPLSWAEIKLECTGPMKTFVGKQPTTSEMTHTVYLQNKRRPFTLRFLGDAQNVDFAGEEDEFYEGISGDLFMLPHIHISIHRETLEFRYSRRADESWVY